jgi:glycosyltransferase involved in cell wall biosynthesis
MSGQLRVLSIITRLNIGGPATHVTVADRGLRARGWDTLLAFGTVEPDEAEVDVASLDVPFARVASLGRPVRPVADLRAAASIASLIRRHRPDVIHTHLSKAGLIGRSVAMITTPAVRVHTFHGTVFGGYFGESASTAIVRAERFLGARTDAVIALSPLQRAELLDNQIAPEHAIHVVPIGLPLARFAGAASTEARSEARQRLDIPAEAFVVAAVGRLVAIKRIDRLLEAFALVARTVPHARLYLVGGGASRPALEFLAQQLDLTDRVTFVGWSVGTPDWYAAADVIALTSEREGTPLALIEAAAASRPVVATDVGGVADVVVEGRTGFVVPPNDTPAFAERLVRLAKDPQLRARLASEAPRQASGFDADRLVGDLDRLYREALARARRPRSVT